MTDALTRQAAVAYYKAIAIFILPHLRNRPVSFKRWIDEIGGEFFWEKDAPSFTPDWVKRFPVPRREEGPPIEYIVVNDVKTLTWIASVGGIEIHPFLHKIPRIDVATHVVFDLDPGEGADIQDCARVALLLRDALLSLKLESFAKVSGSKGMQVYVPLNSGASHELTESFARVLADEMARRHPKLIVSKMTKTLRHKKVFIDWSQNADYKTTVSVYSLRATGLVSMPVTWDEVARGKPFVFTIDDAIKRLRKTGDLFAPVLKKKQRLPGQSSGAPAASAGEHSRRPSSSTRDPGARSGRRSTGTTKHARAEARASTSLPKPKSQSGRRLFLITTTETGDELWMNMRGMFRRWILRPDARGGGALIAMPAGEFAIEPAYHRAEVPARWKGRVTIEDSGAYEIIEGSWQRKHFDLWFAGNVMKGAWTLRKVTGEGHRSWTLAPATLTRAATNTR